jgi:hypothetical protein
MDRSKKMCRMLDAPSPSFAYAVPYSEKGCAPVDDAMPMVVGILGDDPLTSRILGLLLEGAGYEVRALEAAAVLEDPSTSLAGVDLVLFMPLLGDERKDELLGLMKGGSEITPIPVLHLSTELTAERTDSVLPWPWSTEALVRAIEQAVLASGGGEAS